MDDKLLALAKGADVLIYDSQYTPEEYGAKKGWGHSTFEEGAQLAKAAGARQLVLFHHDPTAERRRRGREGSARPQAVPERDRGSRRPDDRQSDRDAAGSVRC